MPIGTCDPASRGESYNELDLAVALPDGSGQVLITCRYTWDGVSTRYVAPGCDGPVIYLRTRNTGDMPAWAMLPDKKKPPLWIQVNPGTDVVVTQKGQLANLGVSNASDVVAVTWSFTDPAAA